ncbi:MAG TPA: hypothetical protein VGK29_25250 [Paludibaculum sp.]|jgi:hypothetical protein
MPPPVATTIGNRPSVPIAYERLKEPVNTGHVCGSFHSRTSPAHRRFERVAVYLHTDVAVAREHLAAHMTGYVHDGLVAGAALCKLGD